MNLDIKRAYYSPFSEKNWYIKLIFPTIVTALGLISNPNLNISKTFILLTTLISLFPNMILTGFFTQFQHNEIHNKTPLLPSLNGKVKDYFVYGLNELGIILIYIALGFVFTFVIPEIFKNIEILNVLVNIVSVIGLIIWIIVLVFGLNAYADGFCFKDAVNFRQIFKLISKMQLLEIFGFIFIAILFITCIKLVSSLANILLVISPIVLVIMQLMLINLSAQIYKIAKDRLEINTDKNIIDISKNTLSENNTFES